MHKKKGLGLLWAEKQGRRLMLLTARRVPDIHARFYQLTGIIYPVPAVPEV